MPEREGGWCGCHGVVCWRGADGGRGGYSLLARAAERMSVWPRGDTAARSKASLLESWRLWTTARASHADHHGAAPTKIVASIEALLAAYVPEVRLCVRLCVRAWPIRCMRLRAMAHGADVGVLAWIGNGRGGPSRRLHARAPGVRSRAQCRAEYRGGVRHRRERRCRGGAEAEVGHIRAWRRERLRPPSSLLGHHCEYSSTLASVRPPRAAPPC